MAEVRVPKTTEEGYDSVVVFWHVQEGSPVKAGDVLVEIQTEKAVFEVTAPVDGVVAKIFKNRGEVVSVGEILAVIDETGAAAPEAGSPGGISSAGAKDAGEQQGVGAAGARKEDRTFVSASPRVRRLARELGVDLSIVRGTGPGGRPTEEDVRRYAEAQRGVTVGPTGQAAQVEGVPNSISAVSGALSALSEAPSASGEGTAVPLTGVRRIIARRMMESLQGSAQLTETAWADVTRLMEHRKRWAPEASLNDWVLRAVVLALKDHPALNAHWSESGIILHSRIHLGMAVDTDRGLLVPVIRDADRLALGELHAEASLLAEKARSGRLEHREMTGSTFTVSNLGGYGIQFFTPILNPPEVGLLGVGRVEPYLVLTDKGIEQKLRLPLSLTFDHRAVDGGPAARFLGAVMEYLQHPERLIA